MVQPLWSVQPWLDIGAAGKIFNGEDSRPAAAADLRTGAGNGRYSGVAGDAARARLPFGA